jgi:hypothetical protein
MTESQAEHFCQNGKRGCCRSVRSLGSAPNRGKWHLFKCILNSKLTTEFGESVSPSCIVDILPAHEELPTPITHLRVREGIITVWFEQLKAYLSALLAVPPPDVNKEKLFHMTVTYI